MVKEETNSKLQLKSILFASANAEHEATCQREKARVIKIMAACRKYDSSRKQTLVN
jgi:hypothetical protein